MEMRGQPSLSLWLSECNEQNIRLGLTDANEQVGGFDLREWPKRRRLCSDNLQASVPLDENLPGCFRHAGRTTEEKHATMVGGDAATQGRDEIGPCDSLGQRRPRASGSPDKWSSIRDDERRILIDLGQVGFLGRQHGVVQIGSDDDGGFLDSDQPLDGIESLIEG